MHATGAFLWLALGAGTGLAWAQQSEVCSACHEQTGKIKNTPHAGLGCAACHPRHETFPHPSGLAKPVCAECHSEVARQDAIGVHGRAREQGNAAAPDCGVCHGDVHQLLRPRSAAFRKAVPETCGMCHGEAVEHFRASVHGKAIEHEYFNAPLCTDCHGEHSILPHAEQVSPVHPTHIRETCGRCHGDVRLSQKFRIPGDRVVSFDESYHGLAARAGSQTVANCASCHGYHNILPSSDPKSTIHTDNLPATCGQCHPGAGSRFALGTIHWLEGGQEPVGVRWARNIYLVVIPLVIGLMVIHNLGDWIRKVHRLRLLSPSAPAQVAALSANPPGMPEVRMYRFERYLHVLLVVSFAVLAWTGFALKYPEEWWARPLLRWESVFPVRGTVHRVAGAVMIGVAVLHVISLMINRRLREHWLHLWPQAIDAREALQNFAYILGLKKRKPRLSAHGYVEKAEYWAVVWGTVIMAVTGVMLWAVNYTLAWLPKSWLDFATTVHFYEAVLATLAIVVWHFYSVIFDPEVYPMDTAWLTGLSVRRREPHPRRESWSGTATSDYR